MKTGTRETESWAKGSAVKLMGGSSEYKGQIGIIDRSTTKMVWVRLEGVDEPQCVYKSSVQVISAVSSPNSKLLVYNVDGMVNEDASFTGNRSDSDSVPSLTQENSTEKDASPKVSKTPSKHKASDNATATDTPTFDLRSPVNIVRGTHGGKSGTIQKETKEMVYVNTGTGTVRVKKSSVKRVATSEVKAKLVLPSPSPGDSDERNVSRSRRTSGLRPVNLFEVGRRASIEAAKRATRRGIGSKKFIIPLIIGIMAIVTGMVHKKYGVLFTSLLDLSLSNANAAQKALSAIAVTSHAMHGIKERAVLESNQLRDTVGSFISRWKMEGKPPCHLNFSMDSAEPFLSQSVVGQERAIMAISDALVSWEIEDRKNSHPLLMLLTGGAAVGKMELARQVMKLAYADCLKGQKDGEDHVTTDSLEGVLLLRGEDISPEASPTEKTPIEAGDLAEDKLQRKIVSHVQKQNGSGAIVVISHVEKMPISVLARLCRDLRTSSSALLSDFQDQPVIFMFTTEIGTYSISESIGASKVEIDLSIRREVDFFFGSGDGQTGSTFDVIAPFVPLGKESLEEILQRRVSALSKRFSGRQLKRISMTKAAARAVLDESKFFQYTKWENQTSQTTEYTKWGNQTSQTTEYTKWGNQTSQTTVGEFSTNGAKSLENDGPFMTKLMNEIERCVSVVPLPWRVAQLDFDASSHKAVVRGCKYFVNGSVDTDSCFGVCHFSLA